jgi:hypothetical protein
MYLSQTILLKENKIYIIENIKIGKQYVSQGKLSQEELIKLIEIDPTPTKKYVGWLSKIWINERPDIDDLRNKIGEYNTFVNRGKAKTKDINQFKSFSVLKQEIDDINQTGKGVSTKDLEKDYDVVIDNADLYIASPHTHEASRKLGLSKFSFRDCGKGKKDSAWCTTYKAPDHFNEYYYKNNATFYYIKVLSPEMIVKLQKTFQKRWKEMTVVALVVYDRDIEGYDGLDKNISSKDIKKFTNIIGIS